METTLKQIKAARKAREAALKVLDRAIKAHNAKPTDESRQVVDSVLADYEAKRAVSENLLGD